MTSLAWLDRCLPGLSCLVVAASFLPLVIAWKRASGLALRGAVPWAFLAATLGIAAQVACFGSAPETGRPSAGHWAYLSSLATLATLISVLGARKPGGGAWSILMGLLMLVFLIPWLEGSGLAAGSGGLDRLRLDPPWAIFFVLLALAGVTNYLPTRYGPAAILVGLSLLAEMLALLPDVLAPRPRAFVWSIGPMLSALGALAALILSLGPRPERTRFDALWLWFRDGWGVVWALRVRERFQRAAESSGWPVHLSWNGLLSEAGTQASDVPEEALRTLSVLLKRFADPESLERAAREVRRPCPPPSAEG